MTELKFDRYKLVVQVVIGENKGQSVRVSSRCLWDTDTDNYASFSFKNVRMGKGGGEGMCAAPFTTAGGRLGTQSCNNFTAVACDHTSSCPISSLLHVVPACGSRVSGVERLRRLKTAHTRCSRALPRCGLA
jgi:hypothetical protein